MDRILNQPWRVLQLMLLKRLGIYQNNPSIVNIELKSPNELLRSVTVETGLVKAFCNNNCRITFEDFMNSMD